jgi:hypothetical protein
MAEARWMGLQVKMARHVTDVLPVQAAALGAAGLRETIDRHLRAARDLGLATERDVARYIDLFVALGPATEADLQASWLGPILADDQDPPSDRVSRAYARLTAHAPEHASLAAWWVA